MQGPQLASGSVFADRFEIHQVVGIGGMGVVYRARDRRDGEVVALKLLHGEVDEPQAAERFTRESQFLCALRHPAIVAHIDHGCAADGRRFLVMEWLDGQDLGARLATGRLPLRDALVVVRRVAEALQVVHARGILHRDIKPQNIHLPGGDLAGCKLLDFSVARESRRSHGLTGTGKIVGTPLYMAPEQAQGSRALTPAVDVFSLGCVLYECLTGEPPFVAEHLVAVLVRILFDEPRPIVELLPAVPASVAALLDDMLHKHASRRIADADALLVRLAGLGELPDLAAATTMMPTARSSFAEREQGLVSLVLAAAPGRGPARSETPTATADGTDAVRQAALLSAIRIPGVRAEYLLDGSLVVTAPQTGSAQDQAGSAARVALLIKERWPEAVVLVATGRGALQGTSSVGEVAQSASQLLARRVDSAGLDVHSGVWLDALSARLLGPGFTVHARADGRLLVGETRTVDESRPLLGKPTPCVGRDAEVATLEAQLSGCIDEAQARVVLVTAPPGTGKSRLRHELLRRIERRGEPVTVLLGRGDMRSAGAPYALLGDAIRRACGIVGGEAVEVQRLRLRDRIATHVPSAAQERVVLFVGELCDVPFPDDGVPMLQAARQEPKIMPARLRRAALDWLAAECAAGPVLLCLDDLQWGDVLTIVALDEALRELAGARLFVLAFARPEVHEAFPELWATHRVQALPLRGLSKRACERLIAQVLGSDVPGEVVARAVDQAGGNALFLEELIRAIAEGTAQAQPETVVAMLQARIGRLDVGARRVVLAAAVFGQTFSRGGVAAILGLTRAALVVDHGLSAAMLAELIQPHASGELAGEREYGFRHALTRDAAYGLLTPDDLNAGHREAARFLHAAGDVDAAVIAEHHELCGDKLQAADGYLRAAVHRLERGNLLGVLRQVERCLACEPSYEQEGQLRGVESYALLWLNHQGRSAESAKLALTRLPIGCLGWCCAACPAFSAAMFAGDSERGLEILALMLAAEPDPDARGIFVQALQTVHAMFVGFAPLATMLAIEDRLAAIISPVEVTNPSLRRYIHASRALRVLQRESRPWHAIIEYQRTLKLCEEAGDERFELLLRGWYLELAWLEVGDVAGVQQRLLGLTTRMNRSEEAVAVSVWQYTRARAFCESDTDADAAAAELIMMALPADIASNPALALFKACIEARLALRRGELSAADAHACIATQIFQIQAAHVVQAFAVRIYALIGMDRVDEAIAVAEQVLAAVPTLGSLGFDEIEFRVAASQAFRAGDQPGRANAELSEALRQIQRRADDIEDPAWRTHYLTQSRHCVRAHELAEQWGAIGTQA